MKTKGSREATAKGGHRSCVHFAAAGGGSNPLVQGGLTFEVHDSSGSRSPATRVVSWGGVLGLDCGFELVIRLPSAVQEVLLTLSHFAQPPRVTALNANGSVAGTVVLAPAQRVPQQIRLVGRSLREIIIDPPSDETLLSEFCWRTLKVPGP